MGPAESGSLDLESVDRYDRCVLPGAIRAVIGSVQVLSM